MYVVGGHFECILCFGRPFVCFGKFRDLLVTNEWEVGVALLSKGLF